MIRNPANIPLRWILRPCLPFCQQQLISSGSHLAQIERQPQNSDLRSSCFSSQSPVLNFSLQDRHFPYGQQTVKSFSSSTTYHDVVQEQSEENENKSTRNSEKMQVILSASFDNLKTLAPKMESGAQACQLLQKLSTLHMEGKTNSAIGEVLLHEPWLNKTLQLVDEDVLRLHPKILLTTLQALYKMTDTDIYVIKSLITQVLWLLRRLSMPLLLQVLQIHQKHQETVLRESVMQQAMAVLERRWVELSHLKDIIFLMYTIQDSATKNQILMEKLEDRALDVVENATAKDMYRIIYLLSKERHRNTPLIRAVVYHLNKTSLSTLSVIQLNNLAYALCILSVFDVSIMAKISEELHSKQADLTPKLAVSFMTAFSRLRWRESGTIQLLLKLIDKSLKLTVEDRVSNTSSEEALAGTFLDATDKVGLVLSLANLNLDTQESRYIVEEILRSSDIQALRQVTPLLWLDLVWALSMLRMLDATSAGSVLEENFWGNLPSSDNFQSTVNMTKISNINEAARHDLEGYTGPFLPPIITSGDAKLLQKGERKVTEKIISALSNMAPLDSYSLTSTTAPGGYLIDAEFFVDSSATPKLLTKALQNPADYHRVALKVLEFPDMTLPGADLIGLQAMVLRHLRCQGFVVVEIRHSEVSGKTKTVELVQFLQQKIRKALSSSPVFPSTS